MWTMRAALGHAAIRGATGPVAAPADAPLGAAREAHRESAGLTEYAPAFDGALDRSRPKSGRTGDTLTSTEMGSAFPVSRQHTRQGSARRHL